MSGKKTHGSMVRTLDNRFVAAGGLCWVGTSATQEEQALSKPRRPGGGIEVLGASSVVVDLRCRTTISGILTLGRSAATAARCGQPRTHPDAPGVLQPGYGINHGSFCHTHARTTSGYASATLFCSRGSASTSNSHTSDGVSGGGTTDPFTFTQPDGQQSRNGA
jgi:hypothetical protein